MSYVKFNQVFGALMVLALLSGFVIPPRYTTKALPQLQAIFAPVSVPARGAGMWVQERVSPHVSKDKRKVEDIKAENQRLRDHLTELEAQLEVERQRNAQWARLGSLKERCVVVDVAGADAGPRDSLALEGSTLQSVRDLDVALFPGGVAGQIQGRAGIGGAQLRLVTDRGFKVRGRFVRINSDLQTQTLTSTVLFEGIGNGVMVVRPPLSSAAVKEAGLKPGDVAVVDERDWPTELTGKQLGTITKLEPKRDAPGFDEIRIEPPTNLEMLREVMVLVKKK
jgi:hypothetical protein